MAVVVTLVSPDLAAVRVTVTPASAPVPFMVGVVLPVRLSVLLVPVSEAAARSGAGMTGVAEVVTEVVAEAPSPVLLTALMARV